MFDARAKICEERSVTNAIEIKLLLSSPGREDVPLVHSHMVVTIGYILKTPRSLAAQRIIFQNI